MTINTSNTAKQHFSGSAVNTVVFSRPINHLYLTTSGTVNMSIDGGTNFMSITAGTYDFQYINSIRIDFSGSGTWSGVGIAV